MACILHRLQRLSLLDFSATFHINQFMGQRSNESELLLTHTAIGYNTLTLSWLWEPNMTRKTSTDKNGAKPSKAEGRDYMKLKFLLEGLVRLLQNVHLCSKPISNP